MVTPEEAVGLAITVGQLQLRCKTFEAELRSIMKERDELSKKLQEATKDEVEEE